MRTVSACVQLGPNSRQEALLYVLPDAGVRLIGTVAPWSGAAPPPDKAILLERSSLSRVQAAVGDRPPSLHQGSRCACCRWPA
jgi:hypothetical protein